MKIAYLVCHPTIDGYYLAADKTFRPGIHHLGKKDDTKVFKTLGVLVITTVILSTLKSILGIDKEL